MGSIGLTFLRVIRNPGFLEPWERLKNFFAPTYYRLVDGNTARTALEFPDNAIITKGFSKFVC